MTLEFYSRNQLEFLADVFPKGNAARLLDIMTYMDNLKNRSIAKIKRYHLKNPVDVVHDLEHLQQVAENVELIIKGEKLNGQLNADVVVIAAWGHDLERNSLSKNNKIVSEFLKTEGANDDFIQEVIGTINQHSFGKRQNGLEAKVLYDADKIEYVSLPRSKKTFMGDNADPELVLNIKWHGRNRSQRSGNRCILAHPKSYLIRNSKKWLHTLGTNQT